MSGNEKQSTKMAALRRSRELMDYANESEESDQEITPMEPSLDDLSFMLRVSRDKRMQDILFSAPLRRRSSRHVQTEPDFSNIPPSWLFQAEKLTDELHIGLKNIINVLGHSSKNYAGKGSKPSLDSAHLKHFTYENGYWHSKLLKNVKIKDSSEIDFQYACLTEDIERRLAHLSEVATKLKNTLPFLMEEFESDSQTERLSRGQMKRSHSLHGLAYPYYASNSDKCVCTEFSDAMSDSGQYSKCSPESCYDEIAAPKRVKSDRGNFMAMTLEEISEKDLSPVCAVSKNKRRSFFLPPFQVSGQRSKQTEICEQILVKPNSKYPDKFVVEEYKKKQTSLVKPTSILKPQMIASCSHNTEVADGNCNKIQCGHLRARGKQNPALFNQENLKNGVTSGGGQKNFIRKNILALRNRSNVVGSNAASHCP